LQGYFSGSILARFDPGKDSQNKASCTNPKVHDDFETAGDNLTLAEIPDNSAVVWIGLHFLGSRRIRDVCEGRQRKSESESERARERKTHSLARRQHKTQKGRLREKKRERKSATKRRE